MQTRARGWGIAIILTGGLAAAGYYFWQERARSAATAGLVNGNGRIEATEIDVATKLPARVKEIFVQEGDFVSAGQPLAEMVVETLLAQRTEAEAHAQQAHNAVATAQAQVAVCESNLAAARAAIVQRETELASAQRRLRRTESLQTSGAEPEQALDDARAAVLVTEAARVAGVAAAAAAEAAIDAAKAQVVGARSAAAAAEATIARIEADIRDSQLTSPRDGRVQFRIAQPGEVLGAGGKVLNLVDLGDVYMTFFLPETVAGRIAIGAEARIVLDAAPEYVIPARISFVASTAQFTPKTVETASERQKLMFRVKAQIDRDLLQRHVAQVKTGLPGVAWVRLDPAAAWPAHLAVRLPR